MRDVFVSRSALKGKLRYSERVPASETPSQN
jgi:hypothetical protein